MLIDSKAERIIENLFDVMMQNLYRKEAQQGLNIDLQDHNVTLDKAKGLITIEDEEGEEVLYSIQILKVS